MLDGGTDTKGETPIGTSATTNGPVADSDVHEQPPGATSSKSESNTGSYRTGTGDGSSPRVYMQHLAQGYVDSLDPECEVNWPRLLGQFSDENGAIVNTYFCSAIPAGVVLTRPVTIEHSPTYVVHLTYPVVTNVPAWMIELLLELNRLHLEVRQFVPYDQQQLCMEIIFSVASQLLRTMQSSATATGSTAPATESETLQKLYTSEVAKARRFYQGIIQRRSQGFYFQGMLVGIFMIALVTGGGFWLNTWLRTMNQAVQTQNASANQGATAGQGASPGQIAGAAQMTSTYIDQSPVLISLIAGGIGAIVSVMQRVTDGKLNLLPTAQTGSLRVVGMFRPVLGGLIAVVVFALLASELLPIRKPGEVGGTAIYFYIAIAFFAGFSERFAQDTLAVGQARLSGTGADSQVPGTSTTS